MIRLPRVFEGPWAWTACGALALLGVAGVANSPLARWSSTPAGPDDERVVWVADPAQYPPALLVVPKQIAPAELGDTAAAARQADRALARRSAAHRAGFDDDQNGPSLEPPSEPSPQPEGTEYAELEMGESRSVLRRLPAIVPPSVTELSPPITSEQSVPEERLPELVRPTPPENFANPSPLKDSFPPPTDNPVPSFTPPTISLPSAGSSLDLDRDARPHNPSAAGGAFVEEEQSERSSEVEDQPLTLPPPTPPQGSLRILPLPGALPLAPRPPANPQALRAVSDRANELTKRGFNLAERGALYSARAEFVQALRLLTQALDAERGTAAHSQSLAAGLLALEEADDFVPKGSQLEANLNVAAVAISHQTPVLKNARQITPLAAVQRYYAHAQEQLAAAGGGLPAASAALYGLGKIHLALSNESVDARRLSGPKSLTLHQAALLVDARNHRAANELGVLLARYGQLQEAKRVLLVSISASRQREVWHNLAVVHERLGEAELAAKARHEEQLMSGPAATASNDAFVRWVPVKEFAASGQGADSAAPAIAATSLSAPQTATKPAEKKASSIPWPWK